MRLLVTAGPTHEPLDDVRYLANRGTGRMGWAVAKAARARGHRVTLVTGPTALPDLPAVRTFRVTTAREMLSACLRAFPTCDAVVMTASVADWRPARQVAGKIKKARGTPALRLAKNPDILARMGRMARGRVVVGFALEAGPKEEALAEARAKLRRKRADLIVLNRPGSLGRHEAAGVTLITAREAVPVGEVDKRRLARAIVLFVEARRLPGTGRGAGERSGRT
jgi:phosphopantothenoylcysteine decarboxylase/phosphopantothenate--cysteine ligase